jgi:hypothetical protein
VLCQTRQETANRTRERLSCIRIDRVVVCLKRFPTTPLTLMSSFDVPLKISEELHHCRKNRGDNLSRDSVLQLISVNKLWV